MYATCSYDDSFDTIYRFANAGFDINSPDSNDSGIQSDARSDDGISNTHGSVSENLSSFVNKSYQGEHAGQEGENDSDENTPTQVGTLFVS